MPRHLLSLLVVLVPMALLPGQTMELRYQFKEGSEYRFKQVEQTTALAQTNDGRDANIDRRITRYFSILIERSAADELQYVFVQDTAIVDENSEEAAIQQQNLDFQNVVTKKRIRVRQSAGGKILSAIAVDPLDVRQRFGSGVSDALFTQRAAIFPALPDRALETGMSWTDSRRDTLFPSKELPGMGRGTGIRLTAGNTEYTIGKVDERQGLRCLEVRWIGHASMEEKIVYEKLEEFTEDESHTSGELSVAVDSGLPVFMDITTEQENTRAFFGDRNNVIPSSIRSHITLELFSQ